MYSDDKKRELIMKHYSTPSHKGIIEGVEPIESISPACVDNGEYYIEVSDDIINDIKHQPDGCAVFISASDILADVLIGKNIVQAIDVVSNFESMINGSDYSEEVLEELNIYNNVGKKLNRATCAITALNGYKKFLNK